MPPGARHIARNIGIGNELQTAFRLSRHR